MSASLLGLSLCFLLPHRGTREPSDEGVDERELKKAKSCGTEVAVSRLDIRGVVLTLSLRSPAESQGHPEPE